MMAEPHPRLAALYRQRVELRQSVRDQTQVTENRRKVMALEIAIFEAEREHGRGMYRFRRCEDCSLLHPAVTRGCDGKGVALFAAWAMWSVDLVHIVE
jgi:hypothetical protein